MSHPVTPPRRVDGAVWHVDKKSGVPLYLQVRELIRQWVVNRGTSQSDSLPTINEVSAILGVAFETVRKGYHSLAAEGLISMSRGRRSVALCAPGAGGRGRDLLVRTKEFIARELLTVVNEEAARNIVDQAFTGATRDRSVIFTECTPRQVNNFTAELRQRLRVAVTGVAIPDLKAAVASAYDSGKLSLVLTTDFHLNEVREILKGTSVEVDRIGLNVSPELTSKLRSLDRTAQIGLICSPRWLALYKEFIGNELNLANRISFAPVSEARQLVSRVNFVLCSADVLAQVRSMAPRSVPAFAIFDHIDPVSFWAVRERVFAFLPESHCD